ncbi:hypothetical protein HDV63DRAFT_382081 [Trichoderma sp. SZMC 28014]
MSDLIKMKSAFYTELSVWLLQLCLLYSMSRILCVGVGLSLASLKFDTASFSFLKIRGTCPLLSIPCPSSQHCIKKISIYTWIYLSHLSRTVQVYRQ